MLDRCSRRAYASLQQVTPAEMKATLERCSDEDKITLQKLYGDTLVAWGGSTLATALVARRVSGRPVLSGMTAIGVGAAVATASVAGRMPRIITQLICREGSAPSPIADIICPAVAEFGPCVDDPHCRALLNVDAADGPPLLHTCIEGCRARAEMMQCTMHAGIAGGDGAEASMSGYGGRSQVRTARHGTSGSSWDSVRDRHRLAQAAASSEEVEDALTPRRRKNAYGDDVMEDSEQ